MLIHGGRDSLQPVIAGLPHITWLVNVFKIVQRAKHLVDFAKSSVFLVIRKVTFRFARFLLFG